MIVYLVESGRDDPVFEALLDSKLAALELLAANKPVNDWGNDWRVTAIEVGGGVIGSAQWWPVGGSWMIRPREWEIHENLP